jgi:hypothetical protein
LLPAETLWLPDLAGHFFELDHQCYFAYSCRGKVYILHMTTLEPSVVQPSYGRGKEVLPYQWILLQEKDRLYLALNEDVMLVLPEGTQLEYIPETLRTQYRAHKLPSTYFETHPFDLGEYRIEHKGEWGYRCMRENREIWTFQGRAYLYTPIQRWRDRIFLGTAGNGGYFYLLDIHTGIPLASIKTGGTASIAQSGDVCYVAANDQRNNSKLLCVDLWTGKVLEELDIEGEVNECSRLQMLDGQIHAVTFERQKNYIRRAIWNVVDL